MTTLLEKEFGEIRKVSTPWCVVRTTDYMSTIRKLIKVRVKDEPELVPGVMWTCTMGPVSPLTEPVIQEDKTTIWKDISTEASGIGTDENPLSTILKNAIAVLPENTMFFAVFPDNTAFENSTIIQAIADLTEPFKSTRRTLIILGSDPVMPAFLSDKMPILTDPLPDEPEIRGIIRNLAMEAGSELTGKDITRAADLCLGMTNFSVGEAVARKLRTKGMDFDGLDKSRRVIIETVTEQALVFEKETWNFDDVGGLGGFRAYMTKVFSGPRKPKLILRIDEIDKDINASSQGAVADNTGASQYVLKKVLQAINDNDWLSVLALGVPGTGKTLSSICLGNQFGVRTLAVDLEATKKPLLGQAGQQMRKIMDIAYTLGGKDVLLIATANRVDTLPPELMNRFEMGIWYWDIPSREEKDAIWTIQKKKFGVGDTKLPGDDGWVGRNIKGCCKRAYITSNTLLEEGRRITPVAANVVESLREQAEKNGYTSVTTGEAYRKPRQASQSRKVAM